MPDQIDQLLSNAGVVGSIPPSPEATTPAPIDIASIKAELMKQVSDIKVDFTNQLRTESEKFNKAVGFIEGSGMGKYDPNTGAFVQNQAPQQDEVVILSDTIRQQEKQLKALKESGELDALTYSERYQDLAPLRQQLEDAKFERLKRDVTRSVREETTKELTQQFTTNSRQMTIQQKFDQAAREYPDVANANSELFKEMSRIYADPYLGAVVAKGNPNLPDKDPTQYMALIQMASANLKLRGVAINNAQTTGIRNDFYTPPNEGVVDRGTAPKIYVTNNDIAMLRSQGITDPAHIKDLVTAIGGIDPENIQGGHLTMEMDS